MRLKKVLVEVGNLPAYWFIVEKNVAKSPVWSSCVKIGKSIISATRTRL